MELGSAPLSPMFPVTYPPYQFIIKILDFCRAIRRVLDEHPDCKAVYPIHMNPTVRQAAEEELGGCEQIHIIDPIEVFDCHNFEARSFLCLTDSGGIQEECPSYGVRFL